MHLQLEVTMQCNRKKLAKHLSDDLDLKHLEQNAGQLPIMKLKRTGVHLTFHSEAKK